jgi:hypothetical protein
MRNAPLMKWQMPSSFCAGIQRSAIIPITAGMNSEAIPIVAKKLPICNPEKSSPPPR